MQSTMHQSVFLSAALALTAHAAQPGALAPVAAPLRDLNWGQLNFLHTTDTHGWLGGHLLEYDKYPFAVPSGTNTQ